MKPTTITAQIEEIVFRLLKETPEGIKWSELNTLIEKSDPKLHPKTINGTVWKVTQKYPDRITKTNGLFRLLK